MLNEDERKILTLRFVVVSLVFLGLGGIEGVMMRGRVDNLDMPLLGLDPQHFYAMLTAHPFVLIYGFAYMAVMGAFYFLVPYVLGRDIYSKKAANASFLLMIVGVMTVWTTTFIIALCSALHSLLAASRSGHNRRVESCKHSSVWGRYDSNLRSRLSVLLQHVCNNLSPTTSES